METGNFDNFKRAQVCKSVREHVHTYALAY